MYFIHVILNHNWYLIPWKVIKFISVMEMYEKSWILNMSRWIIQSIKIISVHKEYNEYIFCFSDNNLSGYSLCTFFLDFFFLFFGLQSIPSSIFVCALSSACLLQCRHWKTIFHLKFSEIHIKIPIIRVFFSGHSIFSFCMLSVFKCLYLYFLSFFHMNLHCSFFQDNGLFFR